MEPMWGRKFEPPAIASWETRRAIDALLDLYLHTGDERYREAAGRAVAWLEASPLSGRPVGPLLRAADQPPALHDLGLSS